MYLDEASVMGTENAIMAAVLAEGETVLGHAACEPHIQDLCRFLVSIGAAHRGDRLERAPHPTGAPELGGGDYRIGPDHIEVASFVGLAAATGGEVVVTDVEPDDLISIVPAFRKLGVEMDVSDSSVRVAGGPARCSSRTTSAARSRRSRAASGRRSRPTSPRSP